MGDIIGLVIRSFISIIIDLFKEELINELKVI